MAALAADVVEEIVAARVVELARSGSKPRPNMESAGGWVMAPLPPPKGAAAVHPHLGHHLARLPGDTISAHVYKHLLSVDPIPSP